VETTSSAKRRCLNELDQKSRAINQFTIALRSRSTPAASTIVSS
jgi:hypothetical protein